MLLYILIILAGAGVLATVGKIYSDFVRNKKSRDMVKEMEEERRLRKELDEEDYL